MALGAVFIKVSLSNQDYFGKEGETCQIYLKCDLILVGLHTAL
jgi:hypothetical protein